MLLAVSLHLLLHFPSLTLWVLQWNAGGLRARSTEFLHFISSQPIDLICIQESNLNSSSSFRISALRFDRLHSRSGILSSNTTHASGSVIIFVRQGLSFSELSTSSSSSLDSYPDDVGFNNSPRSLSLMCMLPLFTFRRRIAEPIPFLPSFFPPPEISYFCGTSIAITPSGTQKVLPTPEGRKYSIALFLLTSCPSMTLINLLFSIAPPVTTPLLPPLLFLGDVSEPGL